MKIIFALLLVFSYIDASEISGHMGLENVSFSHIKSDKRKHITTLDATLKLEKKFDGFDVRVELQGQKDTHDAKRSRAWIQEAYIDIPMGDGLVRVGRDVKFWGALESFNLTDTYNPTNLLKNPYDNDKLGILGASYTYMFENSALSFIVREAEEKLIVADVDYPYHTFSPLLDTGIEKEKNIPNIYLHYSGSTDTDMPLDFAFVYLKGLDEKKILNATGTKIKSVEAQKFMTYDTLLVGDSLFKFEGLYSDIKEEIVVKDYWHIGVGIEHTLYQFYKGVDVGLLCEVYRYGSDSAIQKQQEIFQNDTFLGVRLGFNDTQSSEFLAGVVHDNDTQEVLYDVQFSTRIFDTYKLELGYQKLNTTDASTPLQRFGDYAQAHARVAWYF